MIVLGSVTEAAFSSRRRGHWERLEEWTRRVEMRGLASLGTTEVAQFSPLYRDVCSDLARAQAARYSAPLVDYLQSVTARAHGVLYAAPPRRRPIALGLLRFRGDGVLQLFPRAVRRHRRAVVLAALLFFLPLAGGVLGALRDPTFAFRIVPQSMLEPLTQAYARGFDDGRAAGEGTMMAGFYVNNNVGIALRCFALGIFGGLGSAFFLVDNGLSIGAILGYVSSQGAGGNILTFILGHGSLELGAIVLSGAAGMTMGWAVVSPGPLTRTASLQIISKDAIVIVCGAAVMLLLAAGIEAFWSGSSVPSAVKRVVGAVLFVAVAAYLTLVGRDRRGPA